MLNSIGRCVLADIFLSYARRERHQAEPIKVALESLGLEVFFDVDGLDGGDVFPDVLDRELKSAAAVVSLWSPWSLTRPWIKIESRIAKDRGVLIPVDIATIDPLHDLPAAFYDDQRIELLDFTGDTAHPGWLKLVKSLSRTLRRPELLEREARAHAHSSTQADDLRLEVESLRAQISDLANAKTAAASNDRARQQAFELIHSSRRLEDYRRFVARFPEGAEAFEAERRIDQLESWSRVTQEDPAAIDRWFNHYRMSIFPALAEEARRIQKQARKVQGGGGDVRLAVLGVGLLILGVSVWASLAPLSEREEETTAAVLPAISSVPAEPRSELEGPVQLTIATDTTTGFQLSYERESKNYSVGSEIDPAIRSFDEALSNRLWNYAKENLDQLAMDADEDKAAADKEQSETGKPGWFMPYELFISFKAHAQLGEVIGVSRSVFIFTGGAHPNHFYSGFNYRKGEVAALPLSYFIDDEQGFHELVIENLVAQKLLRGDEVADAAAIESDLREILVPTEADPEVYANRFVLEKSSEAGKAGGISVLFSPYDVGPYSDGPYTVTLTAAQLAPILNEAWKGRFGGELLVKEE